MLDMGLVDEMIMRVIASADRWLTIELAFNARYHASLMWDAMEREREKESVETNKPDCPPPVDE
jgi:hypothetical protein